MVHNMTGRAGSQWPWKAVDQMTFKVSFSLERGNGLSGIKCELWTLSFWDLKSGATTH